MKNTLLLTGLILFAGLVNGQDNLTLKSAARIGINRAFFGYGDIVGPCISAEYSYSFNTYFALTPRIMSGFANKLTDKNFDHASSFGTSLSIRITPLPNSFRRLKFDVGGLYHQFIKTWGEIGENTQSGAIVSYNSEYSKENLFGLLGSASINIIDKKKIESGLRFEILTSFTEGYFNCDSWQTGVYIGMKF
jgi:hypothetical protein